MGSHPNAGVWESVRLSLLVIELSFFLQGAGMCKNGLNIKTATFVFLTKCKPILLYACDTMFLNNNDVSNLEKVQNTLVKCIVGISKRYRSKPLLYALNIQNISRVLELSTVRLFRNVVQGHSI